MAVEKFDYAEATRDAAELLEEFGQVGAIKRVTTIPPVNEWEPGIEAITYHEITIVLLPMNLQHVGLDIEGTLIKADDKQILIAAEGLNIMPTTTDTVLIGGAFDGAEYKNGTPYTLKTVKSLAPAGIIVLHDCIGSR